MSWPEYLPVTLSWWCECFVLGAPLSTAQFFAYEDTLVCIFVFVVQIIILWWHMVCYQNRKKKSQDSGCVGVGQHGEVWPRLLTAWLAWLQISSWLNKGSQHLHLDAEILVSWTHKNTFLKLKMIQYVEYRRCPSRTGVVHDPPWVHIFLNAHVHCILSFGARPHFRPNPYYEDLERMEEEVMSILHILEMENTEIHENNHKLEKEITFSR